MTFQEIKAEGEARIKQYNKDIKAANASGNHAEGKRLADERDLYSADLTQRLIATPEYQDALKHIQQAAKFIK
jgi:hypothetical protein